MKFPQCLLLLAAICIGPVAALAEDKLVFDTEWKGERIELPPGFARDLKLKGYEEIRFAPGMFKGDADDFFSYVLAFSLEPGEEKLT